MAQIFAVFVDQIKIVHISTVELHAQFFLDEMIQWGKVKQGENLRRLIADRNSYVAFGAVNYHVQQPKAFGIVNIFPDQAL